MIPEDARTYVLRSKWVFPVVRKPIEHGCITVRSGVIQAVNHRTDVGPVFDLGNVAILPGLVNCHTHLEFSDLTAPIGEAGQPFPEWIGQVVAHRRRQSAMYAASEHDRAAKRSAAWLQGWNECVRCGTAAIGEIATVPWEWPLFPRSSDGDLHATIFLELLGLSPERVTENLQRAKEHLEGRPATGWATVGLSPHAPYTVHRELLRSAVEKAVKRKAPVAMHLAESMEELELLASGGGPFAELLQSLGVWQPEMFPGNRRPLNYLEALQPAPRTLVIHGNYLDSQEMEWIANQDGRMTVIYCPRTHAYFGHHRYPLAELQRRGVPVAFGTDSRASNPDLSLWEEMRFVARHFPEIDGAEILRMGTSAGARALGIGHSLGVIAPERQAKFTIVPLGEQPARDPFQAIWEGGSAQPLPPEFPFSQGSSIFS